MDEHYVTFSRRRYLLPSRGLLVLDDAAAVLALLASRQRVSTIARPRRSCFGLTPSPLSSHDRGRTKAALVDYIVLCLTGKK